MSINLVEGDITPVIHIEVTEPGRTVDLSRETVLIHTRRVGTTEPVRTIPGQVHEANKIKVPLPEGFTDEVGDFEAEVEIVGRQTIYGTFNFKVRERYPDK
ncbi:hypothetical protein [Oligella urethralis]|uniref:Uncharacterized protein n=1 Tax=Oligella urethralis TaxID=90245 RepID=A0A2X1WMR5_9BURK|nr:hypothetical protein [Oligella urethralis]SPY08015.1 Uncharacterised protein [Oligella urethralis]